MIVEIIKRVNQWLATVAVVLIFVMMVSITADVCLRYFANKPILGVVELNRMLLVLVVFFTLGYAQVRKQHINVGLLLNLMSPKRRIIVETLELLLALVVVGFFTYGSILTAYKSTIEGEYEMGVASFPVWPGRIALAIGLLMLCMQYLADIISGLRSHLDDKGEL